MRYHNITKDDMLNGDGLRVVLWVAGCEHACPGCHNPVTWDSRGGLPFDAEAEKELFTALGRDHIAGITLSGGDPLFPGNRDGIERLCRKIRTHFPDKTIWLYTGYSWEDIRHMPVIKQLDVLIDGPYLEEMRDSRLLWCGSANQRVIDVPKTMACNKIILHPEPDAEMT